MSYDVFLVPVRAAGNLERRRHPFTGEMREVASVSSLSERERSAVVELLCAAGASDEDAHGTRDLALPDGARATIHTHGLERGCSFCVRGAGLTPALVNLIYDVMVVGRWMLVATDGVAAAPSRECIAEATPEIADAFPEVVVVSSAEELAALLSRGVDEWRAYRDRIVGSSR